MEQEQIKEMMLVTNGGNNIDENYVQFSSKMDIVMAIIDSIKMACFYYIFYKFHCF